MAEPDLFPQLVRCVSEYLETDVVLDRHARLVNAIPGIDSLRLQELLLYIEESFGVSFNENVLEKAETLQDLARYIQSLPRKS